MQKKKIVHLPKKEIAEEKKKKYKVRKNLPHLNNFDIKHLIEGKIKRQTSNKPTKKENVTHFYTKNCILLFPIFSSIIYKKIQNICIKICIKLRIRVSQASISNLKSSVFLCIFILLVLYFFIFQVIQQRAQKYI